MYQLTQARNIVALTFVILAVLLLLPVGLSWAGTVHERRAACKKVCHATFKACEEDVYKINKTISGEPSIEMTKELEQCRDAHSMCLKNCLSIE